MVDIHRGIDLKGLAADDGYNTRLERIYKEFTARFPHSGEVSFISAPGRVEIGGNHTDHQNGCVLAASINLDALGAVSPNGQNMIRVLSEGYSLCEVDTQNTDVLEAEKSSAAAFIRGVADGIKRRGYKTGGFNAYVSSEVLGGSGLSSSAAFAVWLGCAMNQLFNQGEIPAVEIAQIAQYAENVHFGKPCGLEDQMASAIGGIVFIDFADVDHPVTEKISSDIAGHTLCVVDSGGNHADLTEEYAAIRSDMHKAAEYFDLKVLRQVDRVTFYDNINGLRAALGDRAVLRACHFFAENDRVMRERDALRTSDIPQFLSLVKQSGRSSFMYLQNVIVPGQIDSQELGLCLALCDELLCGRGAFRVQGGGFAGTIEAFVPNDIMHTFKEGMEAVFGAGSCHQLKIREHGAVRLFKL